MPCDWLLEQPHLHLLVCVSLQLPLELSQSFVRNVDGSYSRFRCPEPPPEPELPDGFRAERPQAIRPMELRTFLKVGEWRLIALSCDLILQSCDLIFVSNRTGRRRRRRRPEGGRPVRDRVDPWRPAPLPHGRAEDQLWVRPPAERSAWAHGENGRGWESGPDQVGPGSKQTDADCGDPAGGRLTNMDSSCTCVSEPPMLHYAMYG